MANAPELSLRGPKGAVAISGRQLRFRRECPVIHPGPARLHPKGTSSRFALRAPRRFAPRNDTSGWVLWCTSALLPLNAPVQRSMSAIGRRNRRIPFSGNLFISAVPGPAVRSPTADNQIGSRSHSRTLRFYDLFSSKCDRMEKTEKGRCRTCNTTRAAVRSSARGRGACALPAPSGGGAAPFTRHAHAAHRPDRRPAMVLAATGMCKVNAALAVQTVLDTVSPDFVLQRRDRRAACPPRSACSKRP